MSLKGTAKETVRILEEGGYVGPSGQPVVLRAEIAAALEGSRLYRPDEAPAVPAGGDRTKTRIEVTGETTGAAARRLLEAEGEAHVAALNFASARNPGGGFLTGAKAQEEDLTRCSALYPCLLRCPGYYEANRAASSFHYTDHIIYSPEVPFFRDERLDLLDRPFQLSIVTAPAPNAGEILRRTPDERDAIRSTLHRRAAKVLAIAAHHGHRTLVLGAWGCGVFRNDPAEVAEVFATVLQTLPGVFARIVFAVYERSGDGPNLSAFRARFAGTGAP